MEFTLGVWRRRNGLWERLQGSIELDIVKTDTLADFAVYCQNDMAHPYFLPKESCEPIPTKEEVNENITV